MNEPLQDQMDRDIDALIAQLELAKQIPGYRMKFNVVDRTMDQIQGFVAHWDIKLDEDANESI